MRAKYQKSYMYESDAEDISTKIPVDPDMTLDLRSKVPKKYQITKEM